MLGYTGVETYIIEATALWNKSAQIHCGIMRKMFEALEAGNGKHLVSIIEPHFESCAFCKSWAEIHEKEPSRLFRRARK